MSARRPAAESEGEREGGRDLWWRAFDDDDVNSETTLSLLVYSRAKKKGPSRQLLSTLQ